MKLQFKEQIENNLIRSLFTFFPELASKSNLAKKILLNPKPLFHPDLPIVIYWSAKSGCSTITKWFFAQLDLLEEAYKYSNWIHNYRYEVFQEKQEYDTLLIKKIYNREVLIVKVVRNPFSRAVSSYFAVNTFFYNNRNFDKFQNEERKKIFIYLSKKNSQLSAFTFREFITYLQAKKRKNIHFLPQTHPSEDSKLVKIDRLIKLENLQEDLIDIQNQLSFKKVDFDKIFKSHHHVKYKDNNNEFCGDYLFPYKRSKDYIIPKYQNFYDQKLQDSVYELYLKDFQRYCYDNTINIG